MNLVLGLFIAVRTQSYPGSVSRFADLLFEFSVFLIFVEIGNYASSLCTLLYMSIFTCVSDFAKSRGRGSQLKSTK
jgi:hypothetical protein